MTLRRPPRRDQGVYAISVAADLTQVNAQTLRSYERAGLIDPARTAGGERRYSDADLQRISRIAHLSDTGVNLTGIAHILALEDHVEQLQARLDRASRGASTERPAAAT